MQKVPTWIVKFVNSIVMYCIMLDIFWLIFWLMDCKTDIFWYFLMDLMGRSHEELHQKSASKGSPKLLCLLQVAARTPGPNNPNIVI